MYKITNLRKHSQILRQYYLEIDTQLIFFLKRREVIESLLV